MEAELKAHLAARENLAEERGQQRVGCHGHLLGRQTRLVLERTGSCPRRSPEPTAFPLAETAPALTACQGCCQLAVEGPNCLAGRGRARWLNTISRLKAG